MSRKHKYRAWDNEEKEMIYDVEHTYDYHCSGFGASEESFGTVLDDDRYIVMEFVGFNDKNKKDIYEGDIDSSGCVVTYLADLNGGLGMNAGWYLQRDNFESWSELECNEYIEIIGNVFENPEKAINNCNTDYTTLF